MVAAVMSFYLVFQCPIMRKPSKASGFPMVKVLLLGEFIVIGAAYAYYYKINHSQGDSFL